MRTVVSAVAERAVVARDVSNSVIVTGDNVNVTLKLDSVNGALLEALAQASVPTPTLRPVPHDTRPPPFPGHLDRESEARTLIDLAGSSRIVNVFGEPGVGKSYLLAYALNQDSLSPPPEGILHCDTGSASVEDLLQFVFDEFYEYGSSVKAGEGQIRRDLRDRQALLIFDPVELDLGRVQRLVQAMPACKFVIVSRKRLEGTPLELGGLATDDAVELFQQEFGRRLAASQKKSARQICEALAGHPYKIRQVASVLRDGAGKIGRVAGILEQDDGYESVVLDSLSNEQKEVLGFLAAIPGVVLDSEHLAAVSGIPGIASILEELKSRHLVQAHSPRYSIVEPVLQRVAGPEETARRRQAVLLSYVENVESKRASFEAILADAPAALEVLRAAVRDNRHAEAIRLGRAIESALAWGRRWGAWQTTISAVLEAAQQTGDQESAAWALHQQGTRAFCTGETVQAVSDLRRALEIRRQIGNKEAAAATKHNLRYISPPWYARFMEAVPFSPNLLLVIGTLVILAAAARPLWQFVGTDQSSAELSVEVEGEGKVQSTPPMIDCPGTCQGSFNTGEDVSLTATASPGSAFVRWEGACSGKDVCRLSLTEDRSVRAVFDNAAGAQTLTVRLGGSGKGTVTSSPTGISCPDACASTFRRTAGVTLVPTARRGSVFAGWQGDCSATAACTLEMSRARSVTAMFNAAPGSSMTLEVLVRGTGTGAVTSEPAGIICPPVCDASFLEGAGVTLTASPDEGSAFGGWAGACRGTQRCTVAINRALEVSAAFTKSAAEDHSLDVTLDGDGTGRVTSQPSGLACPTSCRTTFRAGTTVTLTAAPAAGSIFRRWEGDCTGTGPCVLTLDGERQATAVFEKTPVMYELTVIVEEGGTVTSDPSGINCPETCKAPFPAGTTVGLSATPNEGYNFDRWSDACPPESTCSFTMNSNQSVQAFFVYELF